MSNMHELNSQPFLTATVEQFDKFFTENGWDVLGRNERASAHRNFVDKYDISIFIDGYLCESRTDVSAITRIEYPQTFGEALNIANAFKEDRVGWEE